MFMIHAYYVGDTPSKDLFFDNYQNYALPLIYNTKPYHINVSAGSFGCLLRQNAS